MNSKIPVLARALAVMTAMSGPAAWADEHPHEGHERPEKSKSPSKMAVRRLPAITIISPTEGASVEPTIAVVFETAADLSAMTMGAKPVGVHLHANIDGTSVMPVMEDLIRLDKNRYRYVFDLPVAPGRHTVSVFWSDTQHKTIDSTIRKVSVTVGAPEGTNRP